MSSKMKWKTFKMLQEKLTKNEGIVALGMDKALWHLLREDKIYLYFAADLKDDMGVCLKIPVKYSNYKVTILK